MYLIAGLGNPGKDYAQTRHNAGFMVVDRLAEAWGISLDKKKFKGLVGEGRIGSHRVILLKPQTYMNLSGESLVEAANFYKIPPENILVIFDDVSLDVGKLRIRKKGSAGGHNGIKSAIALLGTEDFPRVKVGVGAPSHDLVRHVLGKFAPEEMPLLEQTLEAAKNAVHSILHNGIDSAISEYNGFRAE
ncbi:aminoacyl-tRNA hydrolase [Proteiniclasticum sp. BAD-10]|uniref:Peptidyl-tRNA hydrolase n=1 Tax=Proteiniclasticum sediminis TaxID=2804028 RepID=A0A941HQE6_9CLOT|nr:aminoacyl-tRNA hydrolase [Proteiniclasticum sediminis]MBR0576404.1 aminoacyl-tRNA hydrolase [Proteiniclasticum sediminis]